MMRGKPAGCIVNSLRECSIDSLDSISSDIGYDYGKPPGERRSHERADRDRAGRFARNDDAVGVATEGRDILLHPLQCGHLIEQTVVAAGGDSVTNSG